jgi:hypothetical protein
MVKIVCIILIGYSIALPSFAQRRDVRDTKSNVRLVRSMPTIYIEFVKAGICEPSHTTTIESWSPCSSANKDESAKSYDAVWLRAHNNSRWAINFDALSLYVKPIADAYKLTDGRMVSGVRNGAEIRARYRVDAEIVWEWIDTPGGREYKLVDVKAPIVNRVSPTGVTSRVWLPPGRSAVFVVKREHLAKYLMIYLPYKYEWEADQNDFVSSEPQHRVYFSWHSLQKALGLANTGHNDTMQRTRKSAPSIKTPTAQRARRSKSGSPD